MSQPSYFGSASTPSDNGTGAEPITQAVAPPSNMRAGDLVIMISAERVAAPSSPVAISATGGQTWSSSNDIVGANNCDFAVFWCTFNGTWGANPSLVFAAETGTIPCSAIMHVFRPAISGTWLVDVAISGGAEASQTSVVVTGVTPTRGVNVTLVGMMVPNASTWSSLSGANWSVAGTAQYRNTSGSAISATFAYQTQEKAAATGDVQANPSTAAAGVSFIMTWASLPVDTGYQINHRR